MTEENSKTNGDEGLIFGQPQTQLFGRGSRKHWHDDEISRMLDAIEKILPRRNRDWKNVVAAYNNDGKF